MEKLYFSLIVLFFGFFSISNSYATPTCSGSSVSSCSGINASSSTCSGYYIPGKETCTMKQGLEVCSTAEGVQCGWNGSYCSDAGGSCNNP